MGCERPRMPMMTHPTNRRSAHPPDGGVRTIISDSGHFGSLVVIAVLLSSAACATQPTGEAACEFPVPSTAEWVTWDEGTFTLQLPPEYTKVPVQGIDSQVGRWEAPGRWLDYDLGFYSNPLPVDDSDAPGAPRVCQQSDRRGAPRIVSHSPAEGGFAIGAHWSDLRRTGAGMTESLTLQGRAERPEDQGELLAIIRSVRISETGRNADGGILAPSAGGGGTDLRVIDVPDNTGYRAGGNEPFWDLSFADGTMVFTALAEDDTVSVARPDAERLADGWQYSATAGGHPYLVRIDDQLCSDSMSGRPFPHTVEVTVSGRTYTGCGGDTASLLTGEEWVVVQADGVETGRTEWPSLRFTADGDLMVRAGCSTLRATYELTGEGFAVAPLTTTAQGCADTGAEAKDQQFFTLLERVDRFSIDDGSLVLHALDHPIIIARR